MTEISAISISIPRTKMPHRDPLPTDHDGIDDFYNLFLNEPEKENSYKKTHPPPSEAGAKASSTDPMTNLGG